jgi:hypothetical protein
VLIQKVSVYRIRAFVDGAHARLPEIVANLQAAFEMYLDFGVECGAIDIATREDLVNRCWAALRDTAEAQAKHQAATEPTARFLAILRSMLTSGRAHLAARSGGEPDRGSAACGWRPDASGRLAPLGECTGWVDGDELYIEPTVAYRLAQRAARESGEALSVSEQTLKKKLHEKGLLASIDKPRGVLTVRRTLAASSRQVLHFNRGLLLPEEPEADHQGDE